MDEVTQRTRAVAAGITPFAARVKSVTSGVRHEAGADVLQLIVF